MARSWVERAGPARRRARKGAHRHAAGTPRLPGVGLALGVVAVGYAASPSALRRRTVLFQYGGPRLGERAGTSVGSLSAVRKRVMLLGAAQKLSPRTVAAALALRSWL